MHHALKIVVATGGRRFLPLSLFARGEQGAWYDPSDLSTVWEDSARTTPASVDGVVGAMDDKSGNGNNLIQATTANKPILRQSGSLYYLEFDGTDDGMATAGAFDLSATDELTACAGVRKLSDAALAMVCELSATFSTNAGTFFLSASISAAANYGLHARGSVIPSQFTLTTYTAPTTNILTLTADLSADSRAARIDGVQTTNATNCGEGNFGAAYPLYVGRRAGSTLPFNGHLYGLIVRGKASTASQIAAAETYIAAKTGVTL